jgi:hypothetical protein
MKQENGFFLWNDEGLIFMNGWENFLMAEVGASAALAGLIFVGVSLNLAKILSHPALPSRAFEALLLLVAVLVVCSMLLVPGQPASIVGIELLAVGIAVWVTISLFDINIWRKTEPQYRPRYTRLIIINQVTLLSYVVSGIVLLTSGFIGLYCMGFAVIASFIMAVLNAWVLLVEINR